VGSITYDVQSLLISYITGTTLERQFVNQCWYGEQQALDRQHALLTWDLVAHTLDVQRQKHRSWMADLVPS
jgi:hypothetical protein